jgi:hypothetical protein
MKRLIAFLGLVSLIVIGTIIMGAASGTSSTSKSLASNESYYAFTPTSAQYLGGVNGKDTLNFEVLSNKNGPVRAVALVDVASRKGSADTYSFDLQGKHFSASTYASVYKGTGKSADYELADTTLFSEIEMGKFYRYWRVQLATDNSCATTDSMTFTKIYIKILEF